MNVEAENRDLKRRVGEIEGSFGFLTEQVRSIHKDVLEFRSDTDRRFDQLDRRVDQVDRRVDQVQTDLTALRSDLPQIVGDSLREVLRERGGR